MFRMGLPVGRPDHRNRTCVTVRWEPSSSLAQWKIAATTSGWPRSGNTIKTILEYAGLRKPENGCRQGGVLEAVSITPGHGAFRPSSGFRILLGPEGGSGDGEFLGLRDKKREYTAF